MRAIRLPRGNRSSFWAFCSSRLTFFLKWEFWMILFKAEAIFASSISKFEKFLPATHREDFDSSIESTISTSVIHNIASMGKSEKKVVTWFLNLIFQHKIDDGVGNLPNWSSGICCLCCPTIDLCGISTGTQELTVSGLLANIGIGIVLPILSSSLATGLPSLDLVFVMTRVSNVDLEKRFRVVQMDSMFQVASVCCCEQPRSWTWNPCWLTGNVWIFPTFIRLHFVEFSRVIQIIAILVSVKWALVSYHDFLSSSAQRIHQLAIIELSSFLPTHECFEWVTRRAFSFATNSSCRMMGVLQIQSLRIRLLLKHLDTIIERFHLCVPASSVQISLEWASDLHFLQEEILQHSLG